ncbi:uncharacterized protein Dvar_10340 [Desulfosarcina variabilis str. Montpellier]
MKTSTRDIPYIDQAGLLTFGSSYRLRLPSLNDQWRPAAFVPDHSGGSIPDSHRVLFYALKKRLIKYC